MDQRKFRRLSLARLSPGTGFAGSRCERDDLVTVSAYALEVMTDLRFVAASTTTPDEAIDGALQHMIARGVRMLLVTDASDSLAGLVTARDIDGPRPAAVMASRNVRREQLVVGDIMTPAGQIEVLRLDEVLYATVGDIVLTLKNSGRQHALVVEEDAASGKPTIRGIFSAAQIARQLGISTGARELSDTFAELERAIAAGTEFYAANMPAGETRPGAAAS